MVVKTSKVSMTSVTTTLNWQLTAPLLCLTLPTKRLLQAAQCSTAYDR
jgi:hypothetical protein